MKVATLALGVSLAAGLCATPDTALAGPMHDFAASPQGSLSTNTKTYGPVTVNAYYFRTDNSTWVDATLWQRNVANDHGLGVCSPNESCSTGGGDHNELSQLKNTEAILLTLKAGYNWDGLWVSSLDGGGTAGAENGKVFWGNSSSIATLLGGSSYAFQYPQFGGVAAEGELTIAGFDSTARYVLFVPGAGTSTLGNNEDYLVWGADTKYVPDASASLPLLGLALAGLASLRRTLGR